MAAPRKPNDSIIFVDGEKSLERLHDWLPGKKYNRVLKNLRDRKDNYLIGLKLDNEDAGVIVCPHLSIHEVACDLADDYKIGAKGND